MLGGDVSKHIILPEVLKKLSGKSSAAAVRRWAQSQNIRIKEGGDGPWTTLEAVNESMGVGLANKRVGAYRPDDVL